MNWFYIDESIQEGDRRQGPVSIEDLIALESDGKINGDTLVWHKGLENWISWHDAKAQADQDAAIESERLLKETVEALLKERAEEMGNKSYAGFWIRALAIIIDSCIISIIAQGVFLICDAFSLIDLNTASAALTNLFDEYSANTGVDFNTQLLNIPGMSTLFAIGFVIQALYFILFTAFRSATPGKMILRLKIERADGSRLGIFGAILRFIFSLMTQATLLFYGLGYFIAIIDPQKRTLHDFFAKTRVVHVPKDFKKD